ncbi:MAG: shikimate dehydrogenase [Eubacterium sp.]|nr:shikimate dehydrogenase [Eubacterium sp.]
MEYRITGHTKVYALIGTPVGHSLSPEMHNYSFRRRGIDSVYTAFDVPAEQTGAAAEAIRTLGLAGCNVTMPHKTGIVQYMDELSPAAELIGAVNTIVNENGVLTGHNTDGEGFVLNLAEHGAAVRNKRIAVAGAGGAATAIAVQCALSGAAELVILQRKGRSYARALETAEKIRARLAESPVLADGAAENTGIKKDRVSVIDLEDTQAVTSCVRSMDILINATNLGMKPLDDQSIIRDTDAFHPGLVVADAVYNPVETKLLREAAAAGCRTVDGRGMLLWQGAAAFRLFTGQEMPVDEVKRLFFERES